MEDPALLAYSDARTEYTKQLCQTIVPAIMRFFIELLAKSKEETMSEPKKVLWHFQNALSDIPDWNIDRVGREIDSIQHTIACEYLEELITAVFIAHTKILTAIRMNTRKKKVQITVPKVDHFLFKVLIETSRIFWKSTYLFRDDVTNIEKQQNYRQIESLVNDGVTHAIRCMVPVKSILKDCIVSDEDDDVDIGTSVEPIDTVTGVVEEPVPVPAPYPVPVNEPIEEEHVPVYEPADEQPEERVEEQPEERVITHILDMDEPVHEPKVEFAEYKSVFDSDYPEEAELVLEEDEEEDAEPFTEFEDLNPPVPIAELELESEPFEEYETLPE
jgi:hypothetical protein